MLPAELDALAKANAEKAPPLTPEQKARLRILLRPAVDDRQAA